MADKILAWIAANSVVSAAALTVVGGGIFAVLKLWIRPRKAASDDVKTMVETATELVEQMRTQNRILMESNEALLLSNESLNEAKVSLQKELNDLQKAYNQLRRACLELWSIAHPGEELPDWLAEDVSH